MLTFILNIYITQNYRAGDISDSMSGTCKREPTVTPFAAVCLIQVPQERWPREKSAESSTVISMQSKYRIATTEMQAAICSIAKKDTELIIVLRNTNYSAN